MTATLFSPAYRGGGPACRPSAGSETEADRLARVRRGDEDARAALVRRHAPRLLVVARRYLRYEEDCADAVQETFLAAFLSLELSPSGVAV